MENIDEIIESVECARIKALGLRKIAGGGAALRAINALADSVEALAKLHLADRRRYERRTESGTNHGRRREFVEGVWGRHLNGRRSTD